MNNKAIILQAGGGYDKVTLGTRAAAEPKAGEITVRLHANSLNYHDFAVVSGMWGPSEARIPMADGAGGHGSGRRRQRIQSRRSRGQHLFPYLVSR